jgi:hypothetical protein
MEGSANFRPYPLRFGGNHSDVSPIAIIETDIFESGADNLMWTLYSGQVM